MAFTGMSHTLPMGLYLARHLGEDYRAIGQTSTDDHVPDMVLDSDSPVGFRVIDRELPPPPEGSLDRALGTFGAAARPSLVDVRPGPDMVALNRIRSRGGYVDTDVSAAFDAVISHPRITRQADLGF